MAVLLVHQAVSNPGTVIGPDHSVQRFDESRIKISHGFSVAAPNTNPATFFTQTSLMNEGDEDWVTSVPFAVATGTPADEVFTATEPAGGTVIAVAATAGFVAGDFVYIRDAVVADSEWAYIKSIVLDTSITLVDPLTRQHALTTTTMFGSAERIEFKLDVKSILRVRIIYSNEGAVAADTHIRAEITQFSR